MIIPGGCTKYIQAPDVCWNKPFKVRIAELYDQHNDLAKVSIYLLKVEILSPLPGKE